jgi:spore coat polysaccharide biosynthesis protein SpsF
MQTVAIIQARMGSTRLPGKVMREIVGRPMIAHVVERARRIQSVDTVVVATSTHAKEAPLVNYLREQAIPVVRGPEHDVLARYVQAARDFVAERVVRITSDCPLLMPEVSERVVQAFDPQQCDYISNTLERTYPRGLDTEVVSRELLEKANQQATDSADREHVTRYVLRNPGQFRLRSVTDDENRSSLRWTVDEEEDLKLVRKIYNALYNEDPHFAYRKVLDCLDKNPRWLELNRHIRQKK